MAVKYTSRLMKKLSALSGDVEGITEKAIKQATILVQREAKDRAPYAAISGEPLRDSIRTKVETNNGKIKGVVYTNSDHNFYIEFGTGPVGAKGENLPAELQGKVQYKSEGWYIPASEIPPEVAERYNFREVTIKGQKFYYSEGQKAQPYLYPALHNNINKTKEIIRKELKKEIRKIAGSK